MSIEIYSQLGSLLFAHECDSLRLCLEEAVRRGTDLSCANLVGANLRGADLVGADLVGANIARADLADANLASATFQDADLAYVNLAGANLAGANLQDAYLRGANLQIARLNRAYITGANFIQAKLSGANLADASLDPIRDDFYDVLSHAPAEVPALIAALEAGRVNGLIYSDGECGCLVGTLAMASGADPADFCNSVHDLVGDEDRPAERFFLPIWRGCTPKNSQHAKIARDWAVEWLARRGQKNH